MVGPSTAMADASAAVCLRRRELLLMMALLGMRRRIRLVLVVPSAFSVTMRERTVPDLLRGDPTGEPEADSPTSARQAALEEARPRRNCRFSSFRKSRDMTQ